MTDTINNRALNTMVNDWAAEIFGEVETQDDAMDIANQYADGSEWVIYYGKAHQLCQHCDTDEGEQWLEDIGQGCEDMTYDKWASAIAYAEILVRLQNAINELYEEASE